MANKSPIMIHKITHYIENNELMKRLDTQLHETTNKNARSY